jgi:hypothetical protein
MRSCNKLSYDREPLNQLLEAAISAYVNTTHSRYINSFSFSAISHLTRANKFSDYHTSHRDIMAILLTS